MLLKADRGSIGGRAKSIRSENSKLVLGGLSMIHELYDKSNLYTLSS